MKKYILGIILILVIIISSIFYYKCFFQNKEDISSALRTKNFKEFKTFVEKLNKNENSGSHWKYFRDITHDYKEGIFEFRQYNKDEKGRITSSYEVFQVKLITSENEIIYYEFSIQKNKKVKYDWLDSYSWEPYYVTLEKFKNEIEFKSLNEKFKNIFHSELNESELFITDYVYGENCGVGAMNSRERIQLNDFVTKKDRNSILKWLKSTNTEKQIYAVEGINKLKKLGVNLNNQELEIIKYVINKKGTIKVCNGCINSSQEIREVIKKMYRKNEIKI